MAKANRKETSKVNCQIYLDSASCMARQAIECLSAGGVTGNLRNPRLQARVAKASLARKANAKVKGSRSREVSIPRFDWTQATRVLEVSCVSEPNDIDTWFEQRWTLKEKERRTRHRSTRATIQIFDYECE